MYSDIELVKSCRQGSHKAQKILFLRYAPVMKMVCTRYIKDKDIVSDILQESFIIIFDKLNEYRGEGSFEGWMRRIVVNKSLDYHRKNKNLNVFSLNSDLYHDVVVSEEREDDSIVNQMLESGFTLEDLIGLLHKLPDQYSSCFNLFYIDGLSHKEIATMLDITENLSRKWVFRAKNLMKDLLMDYLKECRIPFANGKRG